LADLADQTALVTGAQQGIGKAIAVALANEGANVAINYLDDLAAAEDVAAAVRAAGGKAVVLAGDIAAAGVPGALVDATVAAFGKIDILVNNAGMFPRVAFLDMTEKDWDFVHSINLKAGFFCAQAAVRAMVAARIQGTVINVASAAVYGTSPLGVHYAATKGGVVSMTRAMAIELAPRKIRVNAIAPGLTDTAQPRYGSTEEELVEMAVAIPMGRMGRPEDIANAAVFLASSKSAYMTGQTVHVNGGSFMTT